MMDGRVEAIRALLDDHGFHDLPIMSYAAKYASGFYGPREAAESRLSPGQALISDGPFHRREALREVALDIEEGADIVMVKPALSYLDIISIYGQLYLPVAAYNEREYHDKGRRQARLDRWRQGYDGGAHLDKTCRCRPDTHVFCEGGSPVLNS